MKHTTITTIAMAMLLAAQTCLTACHYSRAEESLLARADSAIAQGDYPSADSLLMHFDSIAPQPTRGGGHYRQLLALCRSYVDDALTDSDFSMADSLCRYYRHHGNDRQLALSLVTLGDIYKYGGDFPSAIQRQKEALTLADHLNDQLLVGWACQGIGDLYFEQKMLDECIAYYRRFYNASQNRQDTLRMAYASFRMGRTYMVNSRVDSTIYFFQRAIDFAKDKPYEMKIVPVAKYQLCDIFIQLEQFDKALSIMPHDSLNYQNWAYWHLGMNNFDSAVYYFKNLLGRYSAYEDVDYLHELIKLEAKLHHEEQCNYYFSKLEDSEIEKAQLSQSDEIRRANAQYNFTQVERERDAYAKGQRRLQMLTYSLILALIGITGAYISLAKRYRERKEHAAVQERLLRNGLAEMARRNQSEQERMHKQIYDSDICKHVDQQIKNATYKLSEEDWLALADEIDKVYPDFTSRLTALAKLNMNELRICYLIKLGISNKDTANLLNKTESAISHARARMWKKIAGKNGSGVDMDRFLEKF